MAAVSVASTNFALALFKKITEKNKTDNVLYSPLSISAALAMVFLGAKGNTATQMSETMCFNKATGDIHVGFGKLIHDLNLQGAPYSLSLANRLYGEQSYQFVETFLGDTKKHYDAELEAVDFKTNGETSRKYINAWVEKQTSEKIKDLLPEGVVDNLTRLVLVNAIYFKGNWFKKFKEASTSDAMFKLNKNVSKPVKMMHQMAKFPLTFIPEVNCQILCLQYEGNELSMFIMLPSDMEDHITGLEKLEKQLTYEKMMAWTRPDMMEAVEVQVGLPKFKLEETLDLKDLLISMGMTDAFDLSKGDFSGMSPSNDLELSEVVHKAFVEVNEEGTEAAAGVAAIVGMRCALRTPTFVADHPFLFFISHNTTESILFYGRYCSP
ncbi:leukocyte elastase inhibitor-like [Salvelinus fontinalis]|uniref:leukocyte elastase inhibitor-like n=1 Tax=Salvelinus fontinalis TaxID=8038 RepID=UPI002485BE98|nr:leukocyte elastase inhibitor-like [Salvelinus fontinalis]